MNEKVSPATAWLMKINQQDELHCSAVLSRLQIGLCSTSLLGFARQRLTSCCCTQYRPVNIKPVTISQTHFIVLCLDISTLLHYTAGPQVFCQYRICQTFPGGSMAVLQSHTARYSHTVAVYALAKHLRRFHVRISGGKAQNSLCWPNLKKS